MIWQLGFVIWHCWRVGVWIQDFADTTHPCCGDEHYHYLICLRLKISGLCGGTVDAGLVPAQEVRMTVASIQQHAREGVAGSLNCVFTVELLEEASPVAGVTYWSRRLSLYE